MLRSRSCHGAIGFVAAMLVVSEGYYVYRPATLPVPAGSAVRVEGAPLDIFQGTAVRSDPADCHATRLYGELRYARGDTLIVAPVLGLSHGSPRSACRRVSTATTVATNVSVLHFSGPRTTGLVLGVVATATAVAAILYVDAFRHYDPNMRTP